ncbi:MAG: signal peptidase I [Methylacidiphilales bacterium]|nr:signal peptidase I [Candidatus Methylacidiphilales bacterium]
MSEKSLERFESLKSELEEVAANRIQDGHAEKVLDQTPKQIEKLFPGATRADGWAENIEVIFVALVIALALRTYFVQPFKIPTGSMMPTLWGISQESHTGPTPNIFYQVLDYAAFGKTYHRFVAPSDGTVEAVNPWRPVPLLTFTTLRFNDKDYHLFTEPENVLKGAPEIREGRKFKAGEDVANFSVEAGDHIFVNKMAYNFRLPKQGEVFVFTTKDIAGLERQTAGVTEYYIKRCVGVPGVTLKIEEPYLLSNGKILHSKAFDRNYAKQGGYNGYVHAERANYLVVPDDEISIPENSYWAMGDNSRNSLDSRYWKYVPRENLVGTALMVYWPFSKRWGWIE